LEISVIIPTKDRLLFLQRVLPSYLAQDEVKEVVVVIDGSTDGTREFLDEFCRTSEIVRYMDNGVNRGIPFSKNRGIDSARFEYCFLGEDDLELTANFFGILASHMQQMDADIICGRNIWRRDTETPEESIMRTNKLGGPYVNVKTIEIVTSMDLGDDRDEPILANPMLAKTELFREIRFDEIYRVHSWREETDFQLSAGERGYRLACCPHAICFNFEISNDRGGVHGTVGWRREKWVILNNWRFVKKHENFIRDNFDIGNKRTYIFKFSARRIFNYILLPPVLSAFSKFKSRLELPQRE
jgi:glycosyltransferase involved in cell wall biosynthesis